jgi:hypothetical protein
MTTKYRLFQYCHKQKKVVPIEEVEKDYQSHARDLFIQDEMEPTRNPLNPKEIYTSKSKLRAAYRAAGAIEVGDAYDRGYKTDRENGRTERELISKMKDKIIDRYKHGR